MKITLQKLVSTLRKVSEICIRFFRKIAERVVATVIATVFLVLFFPELFPQDMRLKAIAPVESSNFEARFPKSTKIRRDEMNTS